MGKRTEIKDGDIVYCQGHEFVASNVKKYLFDGRLWVWHYTGTCTASPRNDSIRNTGYNGGRYSWRVGEG